MTAGGSSAILLRIRTILAFLVALSASALSASAQSDAAIALADYSALPVCTTAASVTVGDNWSIGASYQILANGQPTGARGFTFIQAPTGLHTIGTNGRVYQIQNPSSFLVTTMPAMGCRLPPSPDGYSVLQNNGVLVDSQGGVWLASCAYGLPGTFCADFAGNTLEAGVILRNGFRLPEPTVRSMPEPNNAPWNLKWCGGTVYAHAIDGSYQRFSGLSTQSWVSASVNDCGMEPAPADDLPTIDAGQPYRFLISHDRLNTDAYLVTVDGIPVRIAIGATAMLGDDTVLTMPPVAVGSHVASVQATGPGGTSAPSGELHYLATVPPPPPTPPPASPVRIRILSGALTVSPDGAVTGTVTGVVEP